MKVTFISVLVMISCTLLLHWIPNAIFFLFYGTIVSFICEFFKVAMLASYHTKTATPLLIEIVTDNILNDKIWKHLLNTVIMHARARACTHTHTHLHKYTRPTFSKTDRFIIKTSYGYITFTLTTVLSLNSQQHHY